jgi:hypothetical protein
MERTESTLAPSAGGLSRYQPLVLLVAWLGWVFDSMDATTTFETVLFLDIRPPESLRVGRATKCDQIRSETRLS